MFLIEKLPRDSTQSSDEPVGAGVMLSRTIAAELALCLASPWTPPFCKKNSTAWSENNSWLEVSGCGLLSSNNTALYRGNTSLYIGPVLVTQ
jgi:hypothetical protein